MWLQLQQFLTPPIFENDEEKSRQAALIFKVFLITSVVALLFDGFLLIVEPQPALHLLGFSTWGPTALIGLWLIRRGYVRLTGLLITTLIWLLVTLITFVAGGVHTPVFAGYVVPVLLAGLLGGHLSGVIFFGLSILAGLGFLLAEIYNLLPAPLIPGTTPAQVWVIYTGILIGTGCLVYLSTESLFKALARARRNEAALWQSESTFKTLADNANDGVAIFDANSTIVYANQRCAEIFGCQVDELLHCTIPDLVHPEEVERVMTRFRRRIAGEPLSRHFEAVAVNRNGQPVTIEITGAATIIWQGQPAAITMMRDITEQQQAQQALEAQRAFLRQVIDTSPNFVFAKDMEGRYTLVNQAVAEAYGTTVEALVGKTDADFVLNPAEVEYYRRDDQEVLSLQQEKLILEQAMTDAAGQVRWLQTVKRPLIGPNGQVDQILGVSTDITERKHIEEALRLSRDQLRIILQGVADGITVQDKTGNLIFANDAAARITGYPSAQAMLDAPFQELIQQFRVLDEAGQPMPPDQLPGWLALQGEPTPSATVRYQVIAAGKEYWSYVKSRPIFDEQGQVELAVTIFQDVTELKRSEQTQRFLAEASNLLAASLNYETTLASIAHLVVPHMADWCTVDILQEEQTIQRLAVAHVDPAKVEAAYELHRRYPPKWDAPAGAAHVMQTGQSEIHPEISEALRRTIAFDPEHLRLLEELDLKSAMIVPLKAAGRMLGAMTFVWAESGRRYSQEDLALAEDLAHRAAIAVDNARLYEEAQWLNAELEQRVEQRTAELAAGNEQLRREIAERQLAEETIQRQRNLLETTLQQAADGIIVCDAQGQITFVNAAARRLALLDPQGTTVDIGLSVWGQAHYPDGRLIPLEEWALPLALAGQATIGRESRMIRPDQSWYDLLISAAPLKNAEDKLIGAVATLTDITERTQAIAALRESEERFRLTFDQSPIGAAIVGLDYRFQRVNKAMCQITGYSEEELFGKTFLEVTHPDDVAADLAQIHRLEAGEIDQYSMDKRYVRKNGEVVWTHLSRRLLKDAQGKPLYFLPLVENITERKRAEEALRASEQRLRAITENAPDFILELDAQGVIRFINRPLPGYQPDALIGANFETWVQPETRPLLRQTLKGVFTTGRPQAYEMQGVGAYGETRWYSSRLSPIIIDGQVRSAILISTDITEHKQAEEALLQIHNELETRVKQRTAELRQANKVLKEEVAERKRTQEAQRAILAAMPDFMFHLDAHGTILNYHAPQRSDILAPPEEFVGRKMGDILPRELARLTMDNVAQTLQTRLIQNFEYETFRADQLSYWEARMSICGPDEVIVITRDITKRKMADAQLKASLKEKDLLLQEIHHRVKNNLQIVVSLLKFQARYSIDKATFNLLQESQNRIRSMALIHEKLYQSPDLDRVNFADYVHNLLSYLFRSYGVDPAAYDLKLNLAEIYLTIEIGIPCGLIINELVSNSLKHAFPAEAMAGRNKEITISLEAAPRQMRLTVGDNGVGLPADLDVQARDSLGLQLVQMLVEQLEGTLELEQQAGTVFTVTFAAS